MGLRAYIVIFLLPLTVAGQQQTQSNHQAKADSIISFFLSPEVFKDFIKPNNPKGLNNSGSEKSTVFDYYFNHPKSGISLNVSVELDSKGLLIPGNETRGLVKVDSINDVNWISSRQALDICKDQSHRLKKKSLRLTWDSTNVSYDEYNKAHNFRDIMPGNLVWEIDGKVKFRGDIYSGTFQVDVFTGRVARRFAIPWD